MALKILVVTYALACLAVAWRRLASRRLSPVAHGDAGTTALASGRQRELGWAAALLAIAASGFGLFSGHLRWPVLLAVVAAGVLAVRAPRLARPLVAVLLVLLGLYGFWLVRFYQRGGQAQALYGVVLAGAGSWRSELVLPQAYAFLAVGLGLAWRTMRESAVVGAVSAVRPRWALLLPPVVAAIVVLLGPNFLFATGWWDVGWPAAAVAAAAAAVWWAPALAADLATTGLVAFGLYGVAIVAYWPPDSVPVTSFTDEVRYGLVLVVGGPTAALAAIQGAALLVLGVWLVPRTIVPHARALLAPAPDAELASRVERLTQTRTVAVDSAAAEVRRLERDLHDGAQARLVALGMNLRAVERLIPGSPQAAMALVAEARETSSRALADLRNLVRGIYPPVLADRGLADAVRALALDTPLLAEVDARLPGRLDLPVESAVYFAVAEALANAVKHSGARHVQVSIRHSAAKDLLRVEVTDDGAGGADPARGTGLAGVEKRLGTFDGILAVSSPPGGPTIIVMEVPCALSSPRTSSC